MDRARRHRCGGGSVVLPPAEERRQYISDYRAAYLEPGRTGGCRACQVPLGEADGGYPRLESGRRAAHRSRPHRHRRTSHRPRRAVDRASRHGPAIQRRQHGRPLGGTTQYEGRRQGRGQHRRLTAYRRSEEPALGAEELSHRRRRISGRHQQRLRWCGHQAPAGHGDRRRRAAHHHLPQPGALDRATRGRRHGGWSRRCRGLGSRQALRNHSGCLGQRNPLGVGLRSGHELCVAARRAVSRGTAKGRGPVARDAHRSEERRTSDRRERRHRRTKPDHSAFRGVGRQPSPRLRLCDRRGGGYPLRPDCAAGGACRLRSRTLLALRAAGSRGIRCGEGRFLGPSRTRSLAPPGDHHRALGGRRRGADPGALRLLRRTLADPTTTR